MPSISVIVPVYQAEKYLKKCVESVLKQTFSDWELLLIDDGCTDESPAICDQCAAEDDRIRVFHKKKNGGVEIRRFFFKILKKTKKRKNFKKKCFQTFDKAFIKVLKFLLRWYRALLSASQLQ